MAPRWTKDEMQIMQDYYGKIPAHELQALYLPDRDTKSIHRKARKMSLGSTNREQYYWTPEEQAYLEANFKTKTLEELAQNLPAHSIPAINAKASRLHLKTRAFIHWTPEEDQILKENYAIKSNRTIAAMLPGKNEDAVSTRAKRLELTHQPHIKTLDRTTNKRNQAGQIGVHFDKKWDNWRTSLTHNGATYYCGAYDQQADAIAARQIMEQTLLAAFQQGQSQEEIANTLAETSKDLRQQNRLQRRQQRAARNAEQEQQNENPVV